MSLFNSVKGTVFTAVDTISSVAQNIVEKNRVNAKLNRLRIIMKNESELMNRAYITLGKLYYDNSKNGGTTPDIEQKKLFEVIDNSKTRIAKARNCYRKIVDSTTDAFYGTIEEPVEPKSNDKVIDITVACSNENDYKSSPFEQLEKPVENPVSSTETTSTNCQSNTSAESEEELF